MPAQKGESHDYHLRSQTNLRLSEIAREALDALAEMHGINRTAVVEQLIRSEARKHGILRAGNR